MSNDMERVRAALALVREIPTSKLLAAQASQRNVVKALFGLGLRELTPEEECQLETLEAQFEAITRLLRALRTCHVPENTPLTLKLALDAFAIAYGDDAADDRELNHEEEEIPFWQRH